MKKIKIGDCFHFGKELLVVDHFDDGIPYAIMDGNPEMVQVADIPLPTLHLPIGNSQKYGGAWFDMILSGVKKEEYREISGANKTYRNVSVLTDCKAHLAEYEAKNFGDLYFEKLMKSGQFKLKPYKVLHLTNGYGHDKPQLWAHIDSITIGRGNPEWGSPTDRDVFIISLGDVFHTKNLKA